MSTSASDRFTTRVADYVRYRPDYPALAIDVLVRELGIGQGTVIADIGTGPGILARQLASAAPGAVLHAVDPNEAMLEAARMYLADCTGIDVARGTAEATGLADASVDAITVAQAFHWFDHAATRREFLRILRPGGRVGLVWNTKLFDGSPLLAGYRELLDRWVPEFAAVRHETGERGSVEAFFVAYERHEAPHAQHVDWDGLLGRVMSSSYAPLPGSEGHSELVAGLRLLFDRHVGREGTVAWEYCTATYVGTIR